MANNRLTWDNVAAPDFSDSIQASAMASRLMSEGLGSFATVSGDRGDRMIDANSAEALMAAQQYSDPAAWQKAMAEGGIKGATGFDASRLNAEAITALGSRATDLFANASTAANTNQTITSTANSLDERDRLNLASQNSDRALDLTNEIEVRKNTRTIAEEVLTDATAAQKLESTAYVDKIAASSVDQDAARTAIVNDRTLTPLQRQAHLAEFDAMAPQMYAASAASTDQVKKLPAVAQTELGLGVYQQERMMGDATNDDLRNYTAAMGKYGNSGNAKQQLMTGLQTNNGLLDAPEGVAPTAVTAAVGKISDTFDELSKEFPGVPDSVVAHVIENHIQSDSWLFGLAGGDGLEPDTKAAREELAKYNDPTTLATLEGQRVSNELEDKGISEIKADLAKTQSKLALAYDKGLPTDKLLAEIDKIEERAAKITGAQRLSNGKTPQSVKDALRIESSASSRTGVTFPVSADMSSTSAYDAALAQRNAAASTRVSGGSAGVPDWMRGIGNFLSDGVSQEDNVANEASQAWQNVTDMQKILGR